jgi:hypothetical protein
MKLLTLALAIALAAGCGGGDGVPAPTGPTPTPPATASSPVTPATWQGTVVAIRRTLAGPLDTTQTFEGTVTFERGDIGSIYVSPDMLGPLIPAGAVTYVLRPGILKLTHTGSVGPCSYGTGTWDVLMKNSDGFLFVTQNGDVTGRVTLPDTLFPVTVTCPTGASRIESGVQMDLWIRGAVAGARISGVMTPRTVAGTTFSGSWALEGR